MCYTTTHMKNKGLSRNGKYFKNLCYTGPVLNNFEEVSITTTHIENRQLYLLMSVTKLLG